MGLDPALYRVEDNEPYPRPRRNPESQFVQTDVAIVELMKCIRHEVEISKRYLPADLDGFVWLLLKGGLPFLHQEKSGVERNKLELAKLTVRQMIVERMAKVKRALDS